MNIRRSGVVKNLVAGALFFTAGTAAQAATVTYSGISSTDNNNLIGFDTSATAANVGDPNTLDIGVLPFTLTTLGAGVAMSDTLLVTVTAPLGFRLLSLSFQESGSYNATNGVIAATTQMLANNAGPPPGGQVFFSSLGNWGPLSEAIDLSGSVVTVANMSISNQLFATGSGASVFKSEAALVAQIAPIPLPPAAWMLGSALVGLVAVGRRKLGA